MDLSAKVHDLLVPLRTSLLTNRTQINRHRKLRHVALVAYLEHQIPVGATRRLYCLEYSCFVTVQGYKQGLLRLE